MPDKSPRVSVVMPAYNAQSFIADAISSILDQTFSDFEFIIINDGSIDATVSIIKTFADPRIRLINMPRNMGIVAALNAGLDAARGEYIARMDSDDMSLPERFARQVEHLDTHPECAVVGVQPICFGALNLIGNPNPANLTMIKMLTENQICHPGVMIRRAVLDEYNLRYNPDYETCEDYELWTRVLQHAQIHNIPDRLLKYRVHGNNLTIRNKPIQAERTKRVQTKIREYLGNQTWNTITF